MASVQDGLSYEAIGRQEELSRERIRQIVSQSVREHKDDPGDLPRVQIARLEPALRLAAAAVAKGRLGAIPPLLKILAQIDNYSAAVGRRESEYAGSHERLMAKINKNAEAIWGRKTVAEAAQAEDEVVGETENLEIRDSWPDLLVTP